MLPEIHAGSFALLIMVIGTRSILVALQQTTVVKRSFDFFLPWTVDVSSFGIKTV